MRNFGAKLLSRNVTVRGPRAFNLSSLPVGARKKRERLISIGKHSKFGAVW